MPASNSGIGLPERESIHKATTRKGRTLTFAPDQVKLAALAEHKEKLGAAFPKLAVFVVAYNAQDRVAETVNRIPLQLRSILREIFVFDDSSPDETFEVANRLSDSSQWRGTLKVFRNPKNMGYGGNQKIGFRYAIEQGFDYVALLHGDGQYAAEYLPSLFHEAVFNNKDVVIASRMIRKKDAILGGMPLYKWVGNQVLTRFENAVLGLRLSEYHSGYRLYSARVLKAIPFAENTDDFHFDTQIIVQLRALGVEIGEIPIMAYYGSEPCHVNGFQYAWNVSKTVVSYRLHQLHITRRPQFIVAPHTPYTKKFSPGSSHEQILKLIGKPGLALDLGAANGLLTERLLNKGVKSVGVDLTPLDGAGLFEKYIQHDLENMEGLEMGRKFDFVILADVLEHLRNADSLLRTVHDFLKPDGRLIVSTPNIAIWFYRLSLLLGRFNYGPRGILDETHVRLYTLDSICHALHKAGYRILRVRPTSLPFEVVFESTRNSRILKFVDWLYLRLAKVWRRLFAYQFVIEAEIDSLAAAKGEGRIV